MSMPLIASFVTATHGSRSAGMGRLTLLLAAATLLVTGCGLERDGSHAQRADSGPAASESAASVGRYRTEAVRLGVSRPFFMLIDTATGGVESRVILGSQMFRPIATSRPPGADLEPKVPGRYQVKVVPGRRGSALLRLDTVTGKTWFFQLGANQQDWMVIDRAVQRDAPEGDASGSAQAPARSRQQPTAAGPAATDAGQSTARNENELKGMVEVLSDPSYDMQLRIWTAKHMAKLYPVEAAEMASSQLTGDDPRILVAIADTAELDPDGRVRTAFEALAGHSDEKVSAAIAARLGGAP